MKFGIYTGSLNSVNITSHGFFEAQNITDALRKIAVNVKRRYCKEWQFPSIQDPKTFQWIRPDYIKDLHDSLPFFPFVCIGDPVMRNVVWKYPSAHIEFLKKSS